MPEPSAPLQGEAVCGARAKDDSLSCGLAAGHGGPHAAMDTDGALYEFRDIRREQIPQAEARKLAALGVLGKGGYDQFVAPWVAECESLAAQVEALTSQLEKSQAQSLRRFNQKEALDKALEAAEQRAQRAEEALLEVERCANGNASPEVLRRHVRRALSPTDPEEPDALT